MIGKNGRRLFALGRLKAGQMNKTEAAYASYLEILKRAGEIQEYWFQPIKLKVAENRCTYEPDFMVLTKTGNVELHEVKGAKVIFRDDAKVKCRIIAEKYPFKLIIVYPNKKLSDGWEKEEF